MISLEPLRTLQHQQIPALLLKTTSTNFLPVHYFLQYIKPQKVKSNQNEKNPQKVYRVNFSISQYKLRNICQTKELN